MRVAGVDGCPKGWIAAVVELDAHPGGSGPADRGPADRGPRRRTGWPVVTWRLLTDASELPTLAERVGIDIPIGLPSGDVPRVADRGRPDAAAGPSFQCVPHPGARGARSHRLPRRVRDLARECGRAISKQTWFITPEIAEVDAALAPLAGKAPATGLSVAEVHPEVSFAAMAGGIPAPPKKTAAGRKSREQLLAGWLGPGVRALVEAAPRPARPDDALDALACAWTAWRWLSGVHEELGDAAARDDRGLPMRILV